MLDQMQLMALVRGGTSLIQTDNIMLLSVSFVDVDNKYMIADTGGKFYSKDFISPVACRELFPLARAYNITRMSWCRHCQRAFLLHPLPHARPAACDAFVADAMLEFAPPNTLTDFIIQ